MTFAPIQGTRVGQRCLRNTQPVLYRAYLFPLSIEDTIRTEIWKNVLSISLSYDIRYYVPFDSKSNGKGNDLITVTMNMND